MPLASRLRVFFPGVPLSGNAQRACQARPISPRSGSLLTPLVLATPRRRHFSTTSVTMTIAVSHIALEMSAQSLTATMQAIGQICSTSSMTHNLGQCVKLMKEAADKGAKVRLHPDTASARLGGRWYIACRALSGPGWVFIDAIPIKRYNDVQRYITGPMNTTPY